MPVVSPTVYRLGAAARAAYPDAAIHVDRAGKTWIVTITTQSGAKLKFEGTSAGAVIGALKRQA